MLNAVPLAQLLSWSLEPGLLPRVPSGPDRGKSWSALDTAALEGLMKDRDESIRFSATTEIHRRDGLPISTPDSPHQAVLL